MSGVTKAAGPGPVAPKTDRQTRLREQTGKLEGVFVEQLYKAMRATVPEDSTFGGGAGEEMFTGLMDEHLAAETPREWRHGLGEALYTQLRGRLGAGDVSPAADAAATHTAAADTRAAVGEDGR